MEQTILTETQKTVLKLFSEETSLADFYLTGGTALAGYYLHHRDSEDLDFFSETPFDFIQVNSFMDRVVQHLGALSLRHERVHDRRLFFVKLPHDPELKLEFTRFPFQTLNEKIPINGVKIDSLRDITANKLFALIERFEPKDFVDLYFLLRERSLEDTRQDMETKFKIKISPMVVGSEFVKVARIETLPKMHVPLTIPELKSFFVEQAKTLKPNILDQE